MDERTNERSGLRIDERADAAGGWPNGRADTLKDGRSVSRPLGWSVCVSLQCTSDELREGVVYRMSISSFVHPYVDPIALNITAFFFLSSAAVNRIRRNSGRRAGQSASRNETPDVAATTATIETRLLFPCLPCFRYLVAISRFLQLVEIKFRHGHE